MVKFVFDFGEVGVWLAGNRNCFCLVFGGVHFDEMLERIVVNVVCAKQTRKSQQS